MTESIRQHLDDVVAEVHAYDEHRRKWSSLFAAATAGGSKLSPKQHLAMIAAEARERQKRFPYTKTVSSVRNAQLQALAAVAAQTIKPPIPLVTDEPASEATIACNA